MAATSVRLNDVVKHSTSPHATAMDARDELKEIVAQRSLLTREEGYILASGAWSKYYFDLKLTTLSEPHALQLAAEVLLDRIDTLGVKIDAVGGLTSGADPLIVATSLLALRRGRILPGFFVRDKQKNHGTEQVIEGIVTPGMNVVILDDVITQGKSALKAIEPVEKIGAHVIRTLILVDREEGGIEFLASKGHKAEPIFKYSELVACGAVPRQAT
jgi:orotate phosphoribosyltransferase